MSPKPMGRPPKENPKNSRIALRIDRCTLEKLEFCVKQNNSNYSEIIRQGIELVYEKTKK